VPAGAEFSLKFSVRNSGDTIWLAGREPYRGSVRFGVKVLDISGRTVDEVHGRPEMLQAMGPAEEREFVLLNRAPLQSGSYVLKLDLLVQDVCWFEEAGSRPWEISLEVTAT
jgi:hypothetical protein